MNVWDWKLVPGSFKILLKWQYSKIGPFLMVDIYQFYLSFIHLFKKLKHWNLDLFGYWVIGAGCLIKKDPESSRSPPNCSKDYWKLLLLLISINWPGLVTSWVVVQKIYSKMHLVSCTNTHCDVTDLVNHGMVKNTKTWISWERNIIFLRNKKVLNLYFRWYILKSYRFVPDVTFKEVIDMSWWPLKARHCFQR